MNSTQHSIRRSRASRANVGFPAAAAAAEEEEEAFLLVWPGPG